MTTNPLNEVDIYSLRQFQPIARHSIFACLKRELTGCSLAMQTKGRDMIAVSWQYNLQRAHRPPSQFLQFPRLLYELLNIQERSAKISF